MANDQSDNTDNEPKLKVETGAPEKREPAFGDGGDAGGNASPREKLSIDTPNKRAKATKRKWLLVAAVLFAVLAAVSSYLSGPSKPFVVVKKPKSFNLTPRSVLRESFHAQTQSDIRNLSGSEKQQQAEIAQILQQMQQDKTATGKVQQQMLDRLNKLVMSVARLKSESRGAALQGRRGLVGAGNLGALPQNPPGTGPNEFDNGANQYAPPAPPGAKGTGTTAPAGTGEYAYQAGPSMPADQAVVLTPPASRAGTVSASAGYKPNPYAGYIPSGSFMPVALLSGVEAGTASAAQSNPQPVLLRLQNLAQLPGYARYDVRACFATGSAYGSMSSERAYIRLVSLSCVDRRHRLVLDTPLKGYLVDSDGMFGLRGKLVEREGALLGKALLAGFASGLSNAFSESEGTTTMLSGAAGVGAATTLSGSQTMRMAGFSGASSAMQMLAKFYLDQAQSIFPVIEVHPGREATMVLSAGTALHWHQYGPLFIRQVRPK